MFNIKFPLYLNEEPYELSSNPSDSTIKKKLQEKNNSIKIDLDQQPKRNCQPGENNYDESEDHSLSEVSQYKKDKQINPGRSYTDHSSSEIKTSSNNLRSISGLKNNSSSLCSKSKNLSGFNKEEECKAQNLKYSEANNSEIPEEVVLIKKYTEDEIKDLIDEAEQEVYTQRKRFYRIFNCKSLSEYFIRKKYYKLKLLDSDDLLLSEYDLSDFGEFCEFASDPRWKKQISISSQNRIKAKLDTAKDIQVHLFIKSRLCEFETLELRIHEDKLKDINNFLTCYFPISCQYFTLDFKYGCKLQIDYYFNSLINLSSRVTEELYILDWKLRQRQMMTIFKEFKHVRSLKFRSCIFALESVPVFGSSLEGSNVKKLELDCDDYGDNGYGVEHLIEGLSQSNGFLQNLDRIYIFGWGNTEETKEKLKEYVDIRKLRIKLNPFKSNRILRR